MPELVTCARVIHLSAVAWWDFARAPKSNVDYPGSFAELQASLPRYPACLDYLDWLR